MNKVKDIFFQIHCYQILLIQPRVVKSFKRLKKCQVKKNTSKIATILVFCVELYRKSVVLVKMQMRLHIVSGFLIFSLATTLTFSIWSLLVPGALNDLFVYNFWSFYQSICNKHFFFQFQVRVIQDCASSFLFGPIRSEIDPATRKK